MARMSDRGQMLLIGAVVLAVTFVSLAVVLNGSIQTTTDASEASSDVSASETIALQKNVQRDVGTLITSAIHKHPNDYNSGQRTYVESTNGPKLTARYRDYYARDDRIVTIDGFSAVPGERIHDDDTSSTLRYSAAPNPQNWEVTTSSSSVRNFVIEAHSLSGTFSIVVAGSGSNDVRIDVSQSGSDTVITVGGQSCTDTSGPMTRIALTNASVAGTPCNALDFFERLNAPYDIRFENADAITGTYSVLLSNGGQGHNSQPRLYAVDVDIQDLSATVDYESTVRVAPGEPS